MEMSNKRMLPVPQLTVWAALNDPTILKACVPGCERFDRISEHDFAVIVLAAIGPVKARFNGRVSLSDIRPAEGYTLRFEGQGGAAGFAKGQAMVGLTPENDGTLLSYQVKAQVGGRLAQVGSRLIDGAAKKLADEFFTAFAQHVAPGTAASQPAVPSGRVPIPAWGWVVLLLVVAAFAYFLAVG